MCGWIDVLRGVIFRVVLRTVLELRGRVVILPGLPGVSIIIGEISIIESSDFIDLIKCQATSSRG